MKLAERVAVVTGAGSGIGAASAVAMARHPDDIARMAVFLASDDAAMVTGGCIAVDGGRCI